MTSLRKRRYESIAMDLDEESLMKRLSRDVMGSVGEGSSGVSRCSNVVEDARNDWFSTISFLYYGYRESGRLVGKRVGRVSSMPFSDIVLSRCGNEELTINAINMIKRLSTMFVDTGRLHVHDGPFGCIFDRTKCYHDPVVEGDRPFPYFYSLDAPVLKGRVFHNIRTSAQGRLITFVRAGGNCAVSEELREQVLYLVPGERSWCDEVPTKLLALDWQPSVTIHSGDGMNVLISAKSLSTTSQEKSVLEGRIRRSAGMLWMTVLKVYDGVVENVDLSEDVYDPELIKRAHEVAGKRVLLYRPLKECDHEDRISRIILKRVKRYNQLLQKIGGSWPTTITGLENCLSVSMTELIIAGMYDPDVREQFSGLYCFMERLPGCARGPYDTRMMGESDEGTTTSAVGKDKEGNCGRENESLSLAFVMSRFYTYSPLTKSYYAINREVDTPVMLSSDGKAVHFTQSNIPVPVDHTPIGTVACGWLQ